MRFVALPILKPSPSACAVMAALVASIAAAQTSPATSPAARDLAAPVVEGRWVRPTADGRPACPVWGHADGLRVGLAPTPGPRGLMRIYTPYLGQPDEHVINYVAVEPVPAGKSNRGLSELEQSKLDSVRGKRLWSTDDPRNPAPRRPWEPARGQIVRLPDGVEALRAYVVVEPFDNGARVYLRLTFRADRPYEVGIATFTGNDSVPLDRCIVTATMGNYARLRQLHLAARVARASELWPTFDGVEFTPHARFPLADLARTPDGDAVVSATPDEARPQDANYATGTRSHWRYAGQTATQYWRCANPDLALAAQVNGRSTYWASHSAIPGGIAFENFELVAPFHPGEEFWFGVTPGTGETSVNHPVQKK